MSRFKPGDQVVAKTNNSPWLIVTDDNQKTIGPTKSEIVTVFESFYAKGYNLIGLVEYSHDSIGPLYWDADCFEKVITDSQLQEELKSIEKSKTIELV